LGGAGGAGGESGKNNDFRVRERFLSRLWSEKFGKKYVRVLVMLAITHEYFRMLSQPRSVGNSHILVASAEK
jgi:hypothetical protein